MSCLSAGLDAEPSTIPCCIIKPNFDVFRVETLINVIILKPQKHTHFGDFFASLQLDEQALQIIVIKLRYNISIKG